MSDCPEVYQIVLRGVSCCAGRCVRLSWGVCHVVLENESFVLLGMSKDSFKTVDLYLISSTYYR